MLEHVPAWLGSALRNVRAGHAGLMIADPEIAAPDARLDLGSPAFGAGGRLPDRFTADGAGVSPPLIWDAPPAGTQMLALVVEDPDAPAPNPLIHAILWGIEPAQHSLAEGALADGDVGSAAIGRNSYLASGWLPPVRRPDMANMTMCSSYTRSAERPTWARIPVVKWCSTRCARHPFSPSAYWSAPIRGM